jgi:hypothetical protein
VSNFVQTVGVIVATLVSAYAVGSAERNRRLDARRARVERVLDAVIRLADAAVRTQEEQGQGSQFEIAKRRLRGEIQLAGLRGFEHTELMSRETWKAAEVVSQSDQAILELGARLDELAPRPLWRKQPRIDFRQR